MGNKGRTVDRCGVLIRRMKNEKETGTYKMGHTGKKGGGVGEGGGGGSSGCGGGGGGRVMGKKKKGIKFRMGDGQKSGGLFFWTYKFYKIIIIINFLILQYGLPYV